MNGMRSLTGLLIAALTLASCVASQPENVSNVCAIFEERRAWYRAAKQSEQRWGIPIAVNMAIVHQESAFRARAKPQRDRFLWLFPGPRPSSAYGYAQALDSTWQEYETVTGNRGASRSDFADAIDFVAWYNANSTRTSAIHKADARSLYFAYHEGNGGYQRRSYSDKPWLIDAAERVQNNSARFSDQLSACQSELEKNWLQRLIF